MRTGTRDGLMRCELLRRQPEYHLIMGSDARWHTVNIVVVVALSIGMEIR